MARMHAASVHASHKRVVCVCVCVYSVLQGLRPNIALGHDLCMARDRRRGDHVARPMRREPASAAAVGTTAVSPAAPTWVYPPKSKSAAPDPTAVAKSVASKSNAVAAAMCAHPRLEHTRCYGLHSF